MRSQKIVADSADGFLFAPAIQSFGAVVPELDRALRGARDHAVMYEVKEKFHCCHGFTMSSHRDFCWFQSLGKASSSWRLAFRIQIQVSSLFSRIFKDRTAVFPMILNLALKQTRLMPFALWPVKVDPVSFFQRPVAALLYKISDSRSSVALTMKKEKNLHSE